MEHRGAPRIRPIVGATAFSLGWRRSNVRIFPVRRWGSRGLAKGRPAYAAARGPRLSGAKATVPRYPAGCDEFAYGCSPDRLNSFIAPRAGKNCGLDLYDQLRSLLSMSSGSWSGRRVPSHAGSLSKFGRKQELAKGRRKQIGPEGRVDCRLGPGHVDGDLVDLTRLAFAIVAASCARCVDDISHQRTIPGLTWPGVGSCAWLIRHEVTAAIRL